MFNVGDKVIIHYDLASMNRHEEPTIIDQMLRFAGTRATIKCVSKYYDDRYQLDEITWWWHEKWLILDNTDEFDVQADELTKLIGD